MVKNDFYQTLIKKLYKISGTNWYLSTCKSCNHFFLSPEPQATNCGSYSCNYETSKISEIDTNLRKNQSLLEISNLIATYFKTKGYVIEKPMEIIHAYKGKARLDSMKTTLFTVAGVQLIDKKVPKEPTYIPQPSVRLKWLKSYSDINPKKPYSTSFVNITTLQAIERIDDFYIQLQDWLELLNRFSLLNKIKLKIKETQIRWSEKRANGIFLKVNYHGVELGDIGLIFDFPFNKNYRSHLIDIGFGLERLGWIINGTRSYFDVIGPLLLSALKKYVVIDHVRTLTLIVGSNVSLRNTVHGKKIGKLVDHLVECGEMFFDFLPLVVYYYNFWKNFIYLPLKPTEIEYEIKREINRKINKRLLNKGFKKYLLQGMEDLPTYELVDRILKERNIHPNTMKNLIYKTLYRDNA